MIKYCDENTNSYKILYIEECIENLHNVFTRKDDDEIDDKDYRNITENTQEIINEWYAKTTNIIQMIQKTFWQLYNMTEAIKYKPEFANNKFKKLYNELYDIYWKARNSNEK